LYGNRKGQFAAGQVTGRGVAVSANGETLYAAGEDSVLIVEALTSAVTGKLTGSVAVNRPGLLAPRSLLRILPLELNRGEVPIVPVTVNRAEKKAVYA